MDAEKLTFSQAVRPALLYYTAPISMWAALTEISMPAPLIPIAIALAREFLPELVGKIAGDKSGKVARTVVDAATGVTGLPSPERALELLKADAGRAHDFRMALLNHEVVLTQLADADRLNARGRDLELRRLGQDNTRANWMVFADVVGLLGCVGGIVAIGVLQTGAEALSDAAAAALVVQLANLAGYFGLSLRDAHQFEFGSSRGSREKDAMLKAPVLREPASG
jgi:hypothetical protein